MAVEIQHKSYEDKKALLKDVREKLEYLITARPTAVNIKLAADDLTRLATKLSNDESSPEDMKKRYNITYMS